MPQNWGWSSPRVPAVAYLLHRYLPLSEDVWCFVFHLLLNLNRFPTFPSHSKGPELVGKKKKNKNKTQHQNVKEQETESIFKDFPVWWVPSKPCPCHSALGGFPAVWDYIHGTWLDRGVPAWSPGSSQALSAQRCRVTCLLFISAQLCRNSDTGPCDNGSLACDKYLPPPFSI